MLRGMQPLQLLESTIISVAQFRGEKMYRRSLRVYQAHLVDEIKSAQRDAAAAAREDCPYF